MRFLFRAAFWLLVMSAVMPGSGGNAGAALDHAATTVESGIASAGSAVGSLCASAPEKCLAVARSGMAALQPAAADAPAAAAVAAVPLPAARPLALDDRS